LEQQEEQAMRQAVLAEMMEVLNETDRKIVLLRCQENLSFREIARQCGIKEAAARKRFERARKAMIKQKGVTSYEQLFSL
jgi:RNA polymerase sigma-70 factor (ECF subfamily)